MIGCWKGKALLVGILVLFSSCEKEVKVEGDVSQEVQSVERKVVVEPAVTVDVPVELEITGLVHARSVIPIAGELPGRILEILVSEGSFVEKGAVGALG